MPNQLVPNPHEHERPPYEALEEEAAHLRHQYNAINQERNDVYGESDPVTQAIIDEADNRYDALRAEAIATHQVPPNYTSFLSDKNVPEAYKAFAPALDKLLPQLDEKEAELATHAPEKADAVGTKAAKLEASLDYNKAVQLMNNGYGGLRDQIYKIIGARMLLTENRNQLSYGELQTIDDHLNMFAETLESHNLLGEPREIITEANDLDTQRVTAAQEIQHTSEITSRAVELVTRYKDENPVTTRKSTELQNAVLRANNLLKDLDSATRVNTTYQELYDYSLTPYMNPALETALLQYALEDVRGKFDEQFDLSTDSETYLSFVENARSIDVDRVLDALEIREGYDTLPIEFNKDIIRAFVKEVVPPIALEAVKRIEIRPLTREEDEKDTTFGFCDHDNEIGGLKIVISSEAIKKEYDHQLVRARLLPGGPDQLASKGTLAAVKHVLAHEYAHAFHQKAPLAALDKWERRCNQDPTMITAYVKRMFNSNHPHKFAEDFADSLGIFSTRPERLTITSSARFDGMSELYNDFMPGYAIGLWRQQKQQIIDDRLVWHTFGISDEDIRSFWLKQ
jgi:hypothetical protein